MHYVDISIQILMGYSGNPAWKNELLSKETMIHFGIQFSHTDLFLLKEYLQFFLTKLMRVVENYIALCKAGF